jgi:hypothetical protein
VGAVAVAWFGGLVAGAAAGPSDGGNNAPSCASGICTVTYTTKSTTVQTWTPPPGVTTANFTVYGAAGGAASDKAVGGKGAGVSASVADLTTDTPLSISVGGAGSTSTGSGSGVGFFGGGGTSANPDSPVRV